jgi:hypothetical protein
MKTVAMLATIFLVGCSSSPKIVAQKPQYCHTSQEILIKNGEKVDSATLVECTDDQIKRMPAVRLGMANNCGEFTYWTRLGNRNVERKGISCQKMDGSWEIINTTSY